MWQSESQGDGHGVAFNVGLSRLERPLRMMDVTAPDAALAIGDVEAISLRQPVLDRVDRRVIDRAACRRCRDLPVCTTTLTGVPLVPRPLYPAVGESP
jgi:hypothetical protein